MTPEILIVGDPAGRRELADIIAASGYGVALCPPRELNRRVRTSSPPAAIVACIADVDPDVLLAGLRRTRAGASIPVLLYGRLGGNLRDLADVLDLGADHFIEEPARAEDFADALLQYAGPPQRERVDARLRERSGAGLARGERARGASESSARREPSGVYERGELGRRTERLGGTSGRGEQASTRGERTPVPRGERSTTRGERTPAPRGRERGGLGDLHRTLDRLEARLRGPEGSDDDLEGLGLDGIPDVDPPGESLAEGEPLVTEIGEHLRAPSRPVRGDDLTQPSVSAFSRGRDEGRGGRDGRRDRHDGRRDGRHEHGREPSREGSERGLGRGRAAADVDDVDDVDDVADVDVDDVDHVAEALDGDDEAEDTGPGHDWGGGGGAGGIERERDDARLRTRAWDRPVAEGPLRPARERPFGRGADERGPDERGFDEREPVERERGKGESRSAVLHGRRPHTRGEPSRVTDPHTRSEPWPDDAPGRLHDDEHTAGVRAGGERRGSARRLAARGDTPRAASLGPSAVGGVAEARRTPGTTSSRVLPHDEDPGASRHEAFHRGLGEPREDEHTASIRPGDLRERRRESAHGDEGEARDAGPSRAPSRESSFARPSTPRSRRLPGRREVAELDRREAEVREVEVARPTPARELPLSSRESTREPTRPRAGGHGLHIDVNARESGGLGGSVTVPTLLWALHERRFTGSLRLQRQRIDKQLWLRDGEPTFARSNSTADRLVDGLLRRGVLTRPQYETARRLAAKEPRRAGQLLVDAGFLKPRELEVLLREHLARVIDACFLWTEGSWATEPGERSDEPIQLELPLEALLLDGLRYRLDAREIEARLVERVGRGAMIPKLRLATTDDDPEDALADLGERFRLLPEEEAWVRRFDGRVGVAALLAEGADEQGLFALLCALDVAGLVDLREEPELMPAGDREPAGVDSERILERLRLAREADYFELLGLGRDAARSEVRQAYAELSKTFADEALEDDSRRRHARELRELRAALEEARDILVDDAMRSAYLAHLADP